VLATELFTREWKEMDNPNREQLILKCYAVKERFLEKDIKTLPYQL